MSAHVVHVVAAGEVGGAERMLVDLMTGPSRRTSSIALFTPNDELRRLFREADLVVDDRGPVREDPLSFLKRALGPGDVDWLTNVIERRNAGVVHLHTFASQVLGTRAADRAGVRVVRTEHSTRVYDDPSCRPFARWSLPRAGAIVFISEHVRRVAIARMPWLAKARTFVVHNGVDPARFEARPFTPTDRLKLVAVGRLDPRKGLELAIEAVARVPEVELDIVGEGSERARLEALAASKRSLLEGPAGPRVRIRGYAADVRGDVARADAVLSSAREEGLGIALLEGMAMGRPVIAVPVGGIPEIVREGETGWLADARTPSALARVLLRAAADRAEVERRGARARERVLASFTVDAMRARYETIYAQIAA
ncbi:MAG: glycosyltransferase [Labilithrix sp.]|nr:glycosyltransferase [Labilithrix sp.]MCW5816493.1 glycosyltransferase [Labilithrix sp.]